MLPGDKYEVELVDNTIADKMVANKMITSTVLGRSTNETISGGSGLGNFPSPHEYSASFLRLNDEIEDNFYPPCEVRARKDGKGPFIKATMLRLSDDKKSCDIGYEVAHFKGSWKTPDTNFVGTWESETDILYIEMVRTGKLVVGQLLEGHGLEVGTRIVSIFQESSSIAASGGGGSIRIGRLSSISHETRTVCVLSKVQSCDGLAVSIIAGVSDISIDSITDGSLQEGQLLIAEGLSENTCIVTLRKGENDQEPGSVGSICYLSRFQNFTSTSTAVTAYIVEKDVSVHSVFHSVTNPVFTIPARLHTAVITPCANLVQKIVIADNVYRCSLDDQLLIPLCRYKLGQRTRIIRSAVKRLENCGFSEQQMHLMHNTEKELRPSTSLDDKKMKEYYGSKISLYFSWAHYYSQWLLFLGLYGIYLQLGPSIFPYLSPSTSPQSLMINFGLILPIWCTCFIEFWKRKRAYLSDKWKTSFDDKKEFLESISKSIGQRIDGRFLSRTVSLLVVVLILLVLLVIMIYFIDLQDHAEELYGTDSYKKYLVTFVYSCIPALFTPVFSAITKILVEFENHSSKVDAENHRIYKMFALQFINRFSMLFYITFYLQDMDRLRTTLQSLLINSQLVELIVEAMPLLVSRVKSWCGRMSKSSEDVMSGFDLQKPVYDLQQGYLLLLVQFGYVTMFSAAFPLAPILACAFTFSKVRIDFLRLEESRRPLIEERSTLNAWVECLHLISFISVITNCFLLGLNIEHIPTFVPAEYAAFLEMDIGKVLAAVVLEHFLFGIKIILNFFIPVEPILLQKKQAIETLEKEKKASLEKMEFMFQNLKCGERGIEKIKFARKQRKSIDKSWVGLRSSAQVRDGGKSKKLSFFFKNVFYFNI